MAPNVVVGQGCVVMAGAVLQHRVPLLAGILGSLLLGGIRLTSEQARRPGAGPPQRVLIVEAGDAGSLIARETQRHVKAGLLSIGF